MHKRHLKRLGIALLLILLLLFPMLSKNQYFLHMAVLVGIAVISAVSLRLIMTTGQVSFAQAAVMGLGAYATVLLVMRLHWNFWLTLPLAALLPGLFAIPIGWVVLRVKGTYFFLASFALGEALRLLFVNWESLTNGSSGLSPIPRPDPIPLPWGAHLAFESGQSYYYLVLLATGIIVLLMYRIENSRIGMIFMTIRETDSLAEAIGIDIMRYKVLAFAIACATVGIAGSLLAHYLRTISPESHYFGMYQSLYQLVYVVVGGRHSVTGAIVGAVVMKTAPEFLRVGREQQTLLFGVFLILALLFAPGGLVGLPGQIRGWGQRLRRLRRQG